MMRKTRKRNIKKRKTQKRIFFGGTHQKFKLLILDLNQVKSISNDILSDQQIKIYKRISLFDENVDYTKINITEDQLSQIKEDLSDISADGSDITFILIKHI